MANVDKLDLTVAPQAVDDGIEGIPDYAIAAFDSGVRKHFPQKVCHISRHRMILLSVLDLFEASDLADYTPEELAGSSQHTRNH
jgi:hypothetical protein